MRKDIEVMAILHVSPIIAFAMFAKYIQHGCNDSTNSVDEYLPSLDIKEGKNRALEHPFC